MTTRRIIGLALLCAALLFYAADMWHTLVPTYGAQAITLGRLWILISARSLEFVEMVITRHLWSPIWNVGIAPILVAPAWSCFGILGLLFCVFGRPKVSDR
jgi:hypothetical protein